MSYERMYSTNDLGFAIDGNNKWATWGTANIIWSPVPQVNTGLELVYVSRRTQFAPNSTNQFGEDYRIQFSTQVKF